MVYITLLIPILCFDQIPWTSQDMFKKKKYVLLYIFSFTLLHYIFPARQSVHLIRCTWSAITPTSFHRYWFSFHITIFLSIFIAKWWFANFLSRKMPDLKFRECWKMKPFGKLPSIKALFPAQYLFHVSAGIQSNLHILPAFQTKVELLMKSYSIFHHSTYVLFHISFHSSLIPSFTTKLNSWLIPYFTTQHSI